MREPEGIETPLPGKSSERSWSKRREPDIRNVEAEGSSPFTSTKGQVTGLKWDPRNTEAAAERYVTCRRGCPGVIALTQQNLQFNGRNIA